VKLSVTDRETLSRAASILATLGHHAASEAIKEILRHAAP